MCDALKCKKIMKNLLEQNISSQIQIHADTFITFMSYQENMKAAIQQLMLYVLHFFSQNKINERKKPISSISNRKTQQQLKLIN